MIDVFIKRGKLGTERNTHMGELHVKMGIMLPQAKKLPEARKEAWYRAFPSVFRGSMALWTPSSQTSSLQISVTIHF